MKFANSDSSLTIPWMELPAVSGFGFPMQKIGSQSHPRGQDDVQQRAAQVCSHCKSIKKGCDKKLPSCSQCIKRRAVCRYSEPDGSRRSSRESSNEVSSVRKTGEFATPWPSVLNSIRQNLPPSIRLSMLMIDSLSAALTTIDLTASKIHPTADDIYNSQISYIFRSYNLEVQRIASQYFIGVHTWLPILSKKRFYDRLTQHLLSPVADFSILLLTMQLINLHPSDTNHDREVLYLATKTLYAQVQALVPSSLLLAQAGIILSHYERAHGMIESAYVNVGATARMAFALGLHNTHCSLAVQGSDAWMDEEEALCTWWGLVILDRIISLDHQITKRPFATRPVRETDHLPLEPADMDTPRGALDLAPKLRYCVSAIRTDIGSFGREAQAVYMFDRVRLAIEAGNTSPHFSYPLGRELQTLLSMVMEQVAGKSGVYCGVTQMLIVTLYKLHHSALNYPDNDEYPGYRQTVEVALNTITRMVIDIAHAFNRESNNINIDATAPDVAHVIKCAEQLLLTPHEFRDGKWEGDFDQLRMMLAFFNRRWALAGAELHRLEESSMVGLELGV